MAFVQLYPEDHDAERPPFSTFSVSAGKPLPWVEMRIVDPVGRGEDCGPGDVGEVWLRAPLNVMAGYYARPAETAASAHAGRLAPPATLGYRDDEGFLFLKDRLKDMIVSGGENVYPTEVEQVLFPHPAVAEAAVIGVPHERWGETVHALVVVAPSSG